MSQAYLRGWINRTHTQGRRSRLREDLLLERIDMEALARRTELGVLVTAGALPLVQAKKIDTTIQDLRGDLADASMMRRMDLRGMEQRRVDDSPELAALMYEVVNRSGILDTLSPEKG